MRRTPKRTTTKTTWTTAKTRSWEDNQSDCLETAGIDSTNERDMT